jgi:hypothetical protein
VREDEHDAEVDSLSAANRGADGMAR